MQLSKRLEEKPEVAILIIALAGVIFFGNGLIGVFLFDDVRFIASETISEFRVGEILDKRRPLVELSLAINYAISESNPVGYHIFNIIVHVLAALALFGIVRRTMLRFPKAASIACRTSLAASLLWVVHPLQTESVTYIIQRAESMMGLFYLTTIYFVIRGAEAPNRRMGHVWFVAAVVASAAGMACKGVMVTAPLVAILYDRLFLAGSFREVFTKRYGLHAGLIATLLVLITVGVAGGVLTPREGASMSVGFGYKDVTPWEYLRSQGGAILHYLKLSIWPSGLCLDYEQVTAKGFGEWGPQCLIVVVLLGASIGALFRKPAVGLLGLFFFLVLAPTSSFIPIKDIIFEHRMYLPLASITVLASLGAARLLTRLPDGSRSWVGGGLVVVATVALGLTTMDRNRDYHHEYRIWLGAVEQFPEYHRARTNLGIALARVDRRDEAIPHLERAIELDDSFQKPFLELGRIYAARGDWAKALPPLRRAVQARSTRPKVTDPLVDANYLLACALAGASQYREALEYFDRTLELESNHAEAHFNKGAAFAGLEQNDAALESFRAAWEARPDWTRPRIKEAALLLQLQRVPEAEKVLLETVRIDPALLEAHVLLASIYQATGREEDLVEACWRILEIQPDSRGAIERLRQRGRPLQRPRNSKN